MFIYFLNQIIFKFLLYLNEFIDIDECETDDNNCNDAAKCTNNLGSFTCSCDPGFHGDGVDCES